MTQTARIVVYEGPGKFGFRNVPLPEIGSEDMLIAVSLVGVDGSEVHMYRGEMQWINDLAPLIFGDEIVGRVAAIGESARAARGLEVGDRVVVEARWPCNACRPCIDGHYYACQNHNPPAARVGYGVMSLDTWPGLWGGYASHVYVPKAALTHKVPDDMDDKTALMACSVLANGIRWTSFGGIGLGSNVAVVGPGPQGLATVLAATRRGARVVCIGLEQDAARLEVAKRFGAVATIAIGPDEQVETTRDRVRAAMGSIDVAIDVAGFAPAKQLALSLPRTMGAVINPSVPTPQVQPLNFLDMIRREITLFNPRSHPHTVKPALELAARLLTNEGIDLGDFVSHVYPLDSVDEALRVAGGETDQRPIKVALAPNAQ